METEMQRFFKDKTIFLTGGSGFLGKVLIEKVLRSTDLQRIYVLIRAKRGKTIEERIKEIFSDPLFGKLHQEKPLATNRVRFVDGDCTQPNLGLSVEDQEALLKNVQIVVHSAATVRFNEPLSSAVAINVQATLDLIEIAKQMKGLEAFVHVSSAFANCIVEHGEEKYYVDKLSYGAKKICEMAQVLKPELLNDLQPQLVREFPNTYCFTKALGEEAILSEGHTLPICIFRPGMVSATYKEPLQGWIDNLYGTISVLYGAATGVLRVLHVNSSAVANILPVDYCTNAMLACAWKTAKEANTPTRAPEKPVIYNLIPHKDNPLNWSQYRQAIEQCRHKFPLARMIWYPFLIATNSTILFKILCFFYHTIPGYLMDFILLIRGKKRKMIRTYKKIHSQLDLVSHFTLRSWTFSMENTKRLWNSLTPEDQRLFSFDIMTLDWQTYFQDSLYGMRKYIAKEEPETIPKGQQLLKKLLILHRAVQILVFGGSFTLLSWGLFKTQNIIY